MVLFVNICVIFEKYIIKYQQMKNVLAFALCVFVFSANAAKSVSVNSPDGNLKVVVSASGSPNYSLIYKGDTILQPSSLGLYTSIGDFSKELKFKGSSVKSVVEEYKLNRSKVANVRTPANILTAKFSNFNKDILDILFFVSDNNVAISYQLSSPSHTNCEITGEATAFDFPQSTSTIITPQVHGGEGWMKSKPSYEEEYTYFEPIGTASLQGIGYTFPALFCENERNWVLISESGVDGNYVGCKLGEGSKDGRYAVSFPGVDENRGVGSNTVVTQLPAQTSWKTITVGESLKPIVETTIMFDVVKPKFESEKKFLTGRSTWSWILWQDESCNYDDQVTFIDLAAQMGYEYILIDALWDVQIGYDRMPALIKYAQNKGVDVILWYNSNGKWNDAPQGPKNRMDSAEARIKEMAWMQSLGVKGIKVDFFGGDKQVTMKLYEDILTDAAKYGIGVNFHGTTLPRGWERMYPNYMASEAVLASENLVFGQKHADNEAYKATIIPFTRNVVSSMDFGPVFFRKRFSKNPDHGTVRKTTDAFQLATSVLYHSAVQHFGIVPNDLKEQPSSVIDFMKKVPTVWDETRFVDGFPGKFCVLARRSGTNWYVVAVNGENVSKKVSVKLPMLNGSFNVYADNADKGIELHEGQLNSDGTFVFELQGNGGAVIVK